MLTPTQIHEEQFGKNTQISETDTKAVIQAKTGEVAVQMHQAWNVESNVGYNCLSMVFVSWLVSVR